MPFFIHYPLARLQFFYYSFFSSFFFLLDELTLHSLVIIINLFTRLSFIQTYTNRNFQSHFPLLLRSYSQQVRLTSWYSYDLSFFSFTCTNVNIKRCSIYSISIYICYVNGIFSLSPPWLLPVWCNFCRQLYDASLSLSLLTFFSIPLSYV
jgi:hypothetical protein